MSLNLGATKQGRVVIVLISFVLLCTVLSGCISPSMTTTGGCAGQAPQGWSGFTGYDGMLYFGSANGEMLALNPSARNREISFPSEDEWIYAIKAPASRGSMCGSACTPSSTGIKIYGTPLVAEDLVYTGTYGGKIYAFNAATGALRWVYPREGNETIGAIVGNLVIDDDTIYVGSSSGEVYALDAETGDWKWSFESDGKIWTSPAVSKGVVYVSNHNSNLYALSAQDGSLVWETELSAAAASSPVVSDSTIFFGTFDNYIHAVRTADGEEKWKFKGENWFWATPIVKDNIVYAGCLDSKIYAFKASTGKELWRFDAESPVVSTPVLVDDSLVAVTELGDMYVVKADNGMLERTISIGYSVMAPLYTEDDTTYVHARDHYVYAVDVQKGEIIWKFTSDVE